jgi:hypothetical protein
MLTLNRFAYDSDLKRRKKLSIDVNYPTQLNSLTEDTEENIVKNTTYALYGKYFQIVKLLIK